MNVRLISTLTLLVAFISIARGQFTQRRLCSFYARRCGPFFRRTIQNLELVDIDASCQAHTSSRSCMGPCWDSMVMHSTEQKAWIAAQDYICDEDRRAEIQEVARAECFSERSYLRLFKEGYEACTQNARQLFMYYSIRRNICGVVDHIKDCFNENVEEMCGADVSAYVSNIFAVVIRARLVGALPSCFEEEQ